MLQRLTIPFIIVIMYCGLNQLLKLFKSIRFIMLIQTFLECPVPAFNYYVFRWCGWVTVHMIHFKISHHALTSMSHVRTPIAALDTGDPF